MVQECALTLRGNGLTDNESKVLAVNMLPQYIGTTIACKSEAAGVDPATWYRITRRPGFITKALEVAKERWKHVQPEVQTAYIDLALGQRDRIACERIMEEGGLLNQRDQGNTVNIYQQINAAEAQETIGAQWHNVIDGEDTTDHDVNEVKK